MFRLKNDYAVLQIQVNQLLDEKRQMQEANMEALQKSQKELIHTKALIEDLKHKV